MQQFVISPTYSGMPVTLGAAVYLASKLGQVALPANPTGLSASVFVQDGSISIRINDRSPIAADHIPLVSAWINVYFTSNPDENVESAQIDAHTSIIPSTAFRYAMLPAMNRLWGNYATLDNLNDSVQIRLVNVPDDKPAHVVSLDDLFGEVVEEYHDTWYAEPDRVSKARGDVAKYLSENYGQLEDIDTDELLVRIGHDGYTLVKHKQSGLYFIANGIGSSGMPLFMQFHYGPTGRLDYLSEYAFNQLKEILSLA